MCQSAFEEWTEEQGLAVRMKMELGLKWEIVSKQFVVG